MPEPSDPAEIDPGRAALREGIALYNRGEFNEAHEVLEAPWRRLCGDDREIYQGLIQVATAFHQARKGKFRGAKLLLQRGLGRLRKHTGTFEFLPLHDFVPAVEACLEMVERCDDGEGEFDPDRIPRLPEG